MEISGLLSFASCSQMWRLFTSDIEHASGDKPELHSGTVSQTCSCVASNAFDKVSGRLFLHFTVLKARRELGAKPFRNRQSKGLRG